MKRIALLICATLLAVLAVACAPQANDDTATTTTESVTTTTTVNDGDYDNVMDDIFDEL